MKLMDGSRGLHYMKKAGIFLITIALVVGMMGCDPVQFTLDVLNTLGGTVNILGEGFTYRDGEVVDLVAIPDSGYRFDKWVGDVDDIDNVASPTITITMDRARAITANFIAQYDLTINSTEGGSVTNPGEGTFTYDAGTVVNLVAEADVDYRFVEWTGDVDGIADAYSTAITITMNRARSITATFVAVYELTMVAEPWEGGKAIDVAGLGTYPEDSAVEILAEANPGWTFAGWTSYHEAIIDDEAKAETFLTMPAQAVTITANFIFFDGGSGTVDDPYQITDWRHLDNVRNYLDHHFILMNDLDSETVGYKELASPTANNGNGWEPIGTCDNLFTWTFDGQGHEIRHLFIDRPDESGVGLFGVVHEGGAIQNVGVVDSNVTGDVRVGGLVGDNRGAVSNCYSIGSVTGDTRVGGLVGHNQGIVNGSYSTGSVSGNQRVGGLVGHNDYGKGIVSNSYSTGSIHGNARVGGLVGHNEHIVESCYSAGQVNGTSHVGGLVGYNEDTVNNSFWDTETSGQATSNGGTGKTPEEMMEIDTFQDAGWDIVLIGDYADETWYIDDGNDYPRLGWQY